MKRKWLALLLALGGTLPLQAQVNGSLTLTTQPLSEVFWQGTSIGTTDASGGLEIRNIPLGRYSILVVKPGFLAESTEVRIEPGTQELEIRLVRLAGRSLPEIPAAESAPLPPPSQTVATPPPSPSDPPKVPAPPVEVNSPAETDRSPVTKSVTEGPAVTPGKSGRSAPDERKGNPSPEVRIQPPAVIPTSPDTESDLRIVLWWGLGVAVLLASWRLIMKRKRESLAVQDQDISEFSRSLSPQKDTEVDI